MPEDEQPDEQIWLDNEALNDHFEIVKANREAKYGGSGSERMETPDLDQNEATRGLRQRVRG